MFCTSTRSIPSWAGCRPRAQPHGSTSEELTPRSSGISLLRRDVLLDFDELVSSGVSLAFQFGLASLLPFGIFFRPDGSVVLDLFFYHRVEDDGYFVGRCGLRRCGPDFAFHASEAV